MAAPAPTPGQPPMAPQPPRPQGPPPQTGPNKRLQQTQAQVDEVVDIMRVNMDKVLERDAKLSELDDRADALQAGASQFEASAGKLKRKFWWKNLKMTLMLGGIVGVFVIVIIVWFVSGKKSEPPAVAPVPAGHPATAGPVQPPPAPPTGEGANAGVHAGRRRRRRAAMGGV